MRGFRVYHLDWRGQNERGRVVDVRHSGKPFYLRIRCILGDIRLWVVSSKSHLLFSCALPEIKIFLQLDQNILGVGVQG